MLHNGKMANKQAAAGWVAVMGLAVLLILFLAECLQPGTARPPHHGLSMSGGSEGGASVRADCRGPYFAYIGDMTAYKQYLTSEFYSVVHGLTDAYNWRELTVKSRLNETTWEEIIESSRTRDGCVPDVLLFVLQYWWEFINLAHLGPRPPKLNNTVIMTFHDDLHWHIVKFRATQLQALMAADAIMTTYAYNILPYYPELASGPPKPIQWIPHAAAPDFFVPIQEKPERMKILLSGSTLPKFYPYRYMVERWIRDRNDTRFEQLEHPGYKNYTGVRTLGRGYAEHVNKYVACIADGLILNYTVAKVFELPAAGCLLLLNDEMAPWVQELGFEPFRHYIPYNKSSLDAIADFLLDPQNLEAINIMRRRAQQLVRAKHQIHHRVALLHATASVLRANRTSMFYSGDGGHSVVDVLNCVATTGYKRFEDCGSLRDRYAVHW